MNSAQLRQEVIRLIKPVRVQSELGSYYDNWECYGIYRAGLLTQTMTREMLNGEIQFPKTKTFLTRTYVPIAEGDRLEWNDKLWQVESIIDNKYYNDKEIYVTLVEE